MNRSDLSIDMLLMRGKALIVVEDIVDTSEWPIKYRDTGGIYDSCKYSEATRSIRVAGQIWNVSLKTRRLYRAIVTGSASKKTPIGFVVELECDMYAVIDELRKITESAITQEAEKATLEKATLEEAGDAMRPVAVILDDVEITIEVEGSTVGDRYNSIVGNISALTEGINDSFSLSDTKELHDAFLEAKGKIESLTVAAPGKFKDFVKKYTGKIPYGKQLMESVSPTLAENASAQKNINYLFGIIHGKYEKLVTVGEGLQASKGHITAQVAALRELLIESNEALAAYTDPADRPIRELSVNTQIKASIEKYLDRLQKITGTITVTQATILALGKDLPAMKADLIDEMAISGLLSSVGDYHEMFGAVANLVAGVAETTSEQVYTTIENLYDVQINDTHTMEYVEKSAGRAAGLKKMMSEKSKLLVEKVYKDAVFMGNLSTENALPYHKTQAPKRVAS